MQWLFDNTHKLMRCRLPACQQFRYFIPKKPDQKYCSKDCKDLAESSRVVV